MQQHIHTIVKHFFQKDSLQEVPEQALQQFTEEHPYSSVGHWLLAKKLRLSSDERYEKQSARAASWFNNPLWLNWTLEDHEKTPETLIIPALVKEQPFIAAQAPEITIAAPEAAPAYTIAPEPELEIIAEPEPEPEVIAGPETPVVEEAVVPAVEAPQPEEEDIETEIFIPGVSEPVSLIEVEVPVKPEEPVAEPEIVQEAEEEVAEVVEVEAPAPDEIPVEVVAAIEEEQPAEEPELVAEPAAPVVEAAIAAEQPAEVPAPPPAPVRVLRLDEFKPVLSEVEEPIFEPYHTIDYFASLGIKLKQEDLKDKLGMQLKSFTEWLRSMKRITPTAIEMNASAFDETMQQSIQEIAGHSIEGKEVLTEAMADVWAKQGNRQKAIAIYEKLSLLNPVKSAYFAAQIEKLKAS